MMPCQIFSHSVFCSCLEDISFELDRRDDEQLVAEIEKLSLEVTTSAPVHNPSLPIDEHKEDILNTVKSQRVTIIHGETGESPFFV
jgi:HrpA-like RNA helicase